MTNIDDAIIDSEYDEIANIDENIERIANMDKNMKRIADNLERIANILWFFDEEYQLGEGFVVKVRK